MSCSTETGHALRAVGGESMEDRMVAFDRSVGARPTLMGTRHMVAAGHYLAAQAGFEIFEGGGNAVDAGVAACITLAVVQSEYVSVGGVAPMMIYEAAAGEVTTIDGLGVW